MKNMQGNDKNYNNVYKATETLTSTQKKNMFDIREESQKFVEWWGARLCLNNWGLIASI